jgi:hypothetical protein
MTASLVMAAAAPEAATIILSSRGQTCRKRVVSLTYIAPQCLFRHLDRHEIHRMRGTYVNLVTAVVPAPISMVDIPRHMVSAPSWVVMRDTACITPLYTAALVGLTTCILVYSQLDRTPTEDTLMASMGYITVCSAMPATAPATACPSKVASGKLS